MFLKTFRLFTLIFIFCFVHISLAGSKQPHADKFEGYYYCAKNPNSSSCNSEGVLIAPIPAAAKAPAPAPAPVPVPEPVKPQQPKQPHADKFEGYYYCAKNPNSSSCNSEGVLIAPIPAAKKAPAAPAPAQGSGGNAFLVPRPIPKTPAAKTPSPLPQAEKAPPPPEQRSVQPVAQPAESPKSHARPAEPPTPAKPAEPLEPAKSESVDTGEKVIDQPVAGSVTEQVVQRAGNDPGENVPNVSQPTVQHPASSLPLEPAPPTEPSPASKAEPPPFQVQQQPPPATTVDEQKPNKPKENEQEQAAKTEKASENVPEPLTEVQKKMCQSAEQTLNACMTDAEPAEKNCDSENGEMGSWINRTHQMEMTMRMAGQAGQIALPAICSSVSTVIGGLNTALLAFESMCNSSRNSCLSSCSKARRDIEGCPEGYKSYLTLQDRLDEVREKLRKCESYKGRVQEVTQSAGSVMNSIQMSQVCAAYSKAMNQGSLCSRDPSAPGCANLGPQNCNNPAFAANNLVCICMSSPNDLRCKGTASASAAGTAFSDVGGTGTPSLKTTGSSGLGQENMGGGLGPDGLPLAGGAGGAGGAGAPGEDPGGKKQSGAALNPSSGGGNQGNSHSAGGGAGGSGYERNSQQVYAGNWGSGSGGGQFGGGSRSASSSGASGGYYRNPSAADMNQYRPAQMKMNKFSPGITGLTGPDGVTGPNSSTIWQKVTNRYQAKSYSLKQRP